MRANFCDPHSEHVQETLFSQTGIRSIVNTTAEISQFSAEAEGSRIINYSSLDNNGVIAVLLAGSVGSQGTSNNTIKVKLGSTVLITGTSQIPNVTNAAVSLRMYMRKTASGILITGQTILAHSNPLVRSLYHLGYQPSVAEELLDITYQIDQASPDNFLTIQVATLTLL